MSVVTKKRPRRRRVNFQDEIKVNINHESFRTKSSSTSMSKSLPNPRYIDLLGVVLTASSDLAVVLGITLITKILALIKNYCQSFILI